MQAGNKLFLRKIIFLNFNKLQRDSNLQLSNPQQTHELSGFGFESRCCHLIFRYGACF